MKIRMVAVLCAVAVLAACSSNEETIDPNAGSGANAAETPAPDTVEYFNLVVGDRVFFETDQSDLNTRAQATLRKQAEWLNTYGDNTLVIEGHADERGTRDYNLALGARRATSVRNFLVGQGVSSSRLRTVTFGKERPVALCSEQSCWSQNRRGVSVVGAGPSS
ncbi:MAG: peptidoglycan-associated lipoprotein Pal [Pseudomonadota bacterium]